MRVTGNVVPLTEVARALTRTEPSIARRSGPMPKVAGARAYMRLASTSYDTQLAHADGTKAERLYVCQRSVE